VRSPRGEREGGHHFASVRDRHDDHSRDRAGCRFSAGARRLNTAFPETARTDAPAAAVRPRAPMGVAALRRPRCAAAESSGLQTRRPPRQRKPGAPVGSQQTVEPHAGQKLNVAPFAAIAEPRPLRRASLDCHGLARESAPAFAKTLPVRFWHSRQWQMEMRTGSPSHVRRSCPQLHDATRHSHCAFRPQSCCER
jgi:hypothetical protein